MFSSTFNLENINRKISKVQEIDNKLHKLRIERKELIEKLNIDSKTRDYYESYLINEKVKDSQKLIGDKLFNIRVNMEKEVVNDDKLLNLFTIREELLDMEMEDLNEDTLESSYIFESSFLDDLIEDIRFSKEELPKRKRIKLPKGNTEYKPANIKLKNCNVIYQ